MKTIALLSQKGGTGDAGGDPAPCRLGLIRVKRVKTELGFKVVQDCNAYDLHPPRGLGVLAVQLFAGLPSPPLPHRPKKGGFGPAKEARRISGIAGNKATWQ
jgi:hypothetical protein